MALSLSEQLANVETAIAKAENAQGYGVGSRHVNYASLEALYRRRDQLQDRIDRDSNGMFYGAQIDRPNMGT